MDEIKKYDDLRVLNPRSKEWSDVIFKSEEEYLAYSEVCESLECSILKLKGKTMKDLQKKIKQKIKTNLTINQIVVKMPDILPIKQQVTSKKTEAIIHVDERSD